MIMLLL